MLFHIVCRDKPGHGDVRAATRDAHVAYLKDQGEALVFSGPLVDDDDEAMVGSMLVFDLPDRAAVEALAAGDPYAQAGLFERVEITRWRKVFG